MTPNRNSFKYKAEWREARDKEFEKYSIHDSGQFIITGIAVAFLIIAARALDSPFGPGSIPNIFVYFLGLVVLVPINAFGIMLMKRERTIGIGNLIELLTFAGLLVLTLYTLNYSHI